MAVIAGNQICIPVVTGAAGRIITAMEGLLASRRRGHITRRMFIQRWASMRKALFLTGEYQSFRTAVLIRCKGMCEECNKHPAEHVHHLRPVAFSPRLALITANAKGACVGCHSKLDKVARKQALQHRNATEHPSGDPISPQHNSILPAARSARNSVQGASR